MKWEMRFLAAGLLVIALYWVLPHECQTRGAQKMCYSPLAGLLYNRCILAATYPAGMTEQNCALRANMIKNPDFQGFE